MKGSRGKRAVAKGGKMEESEVNVAKAESSLNGQESGVVEVK